MYSTSKIKAAAVTLGLLLAIASAATAQAGGPLGMTAQQLKSVRARAEAMDRFYHLGKYSPQAVAQQAENRYWQAANQYYHLGR